MECKYCYKLLSTSLALHIHLKISRECKRIRKELPMFECENCSATFVSLKRLENHVCRCTPEIRDDIENEYVFVFDYK